MTHRKVTRETEPFGKATFCLLVATWAVLFVLYCGASFGPSPASLASEKCSGSNCQQAVVPSKDAVAMAAELGRLDIVSIGLTVIGVLLALMAFGAYFHAQAIVERKTVEFLRKTAPDLIKSAVTADLLKEALRDPVVLEAIRASIGTNGISDTEANDIAQSIGGSDEKEGER